MREKESVWKGPTIGALLGAGGGLAAGNYWPEQEYSLPELGGDPPPSRNKRRIAGALAGALLGTLTGTTISGAGAALRGTNKAINQPLRRAIKHYTR